MSKRVVNASVMSGSHGTDDDKPKGTPMMTQDTRIALYLRERGSVRIGRLTPAQRRRVNQHRFDCPTCSVKGSNVCRTATGKTAKSRHSARLKENA